MRVRDLIELLSRPDFNLDATVHFAYDYGDYWHTKVAPEIEDAVEGKVVYSDYHRMPAIVELYDEEGEDNPGADAGTNVVILS